MHTYLSDYMQAWTRWIMIAVGLSVAAVLFAASMYLGVHLMLWALRFVGADL